MLDFFDLNMDGKVDAMDFMIAEEIYEEEEEQENNLDNNQSNK